MISSILLCLIAAVTALPAPQSDPDPAISPCAGNDANDRSVWCEHSIDTDWYLDVPETGVTREYWLDITNQTLAPDGIERIVLAFNGTFPGPLIEANWGDNVVIHVHNSLTENGTSIHWHGIRQNLTVLDDGVPSITQCPIAPGDTLTYRWRATQYGTGWYHSHYSLQAWEGAAGPMIIHGPATANYDEDLGTVFLTDWGHNTADFLYHEAQVDGPPTLNNALINGQNTYNNSGTITGSRYEASFEPGKRYRIRLINGAIDTHFKFSIDNHSFTVIASDYVPLVPFEANTIELTMGQRYDLIVEANQEPGDYWLRAIPQVTCSNVESPDNIRGIIRYSTVSSTDDPTTTAWNQTDSCDDVPLESLVPYLSQNVVDPTADDSDMTVSVFRNENNLFRWSIGPETMLVKWAEPSLRQIWDGNATFEASEAVISLPDADRWIYFVIDTQVPVPHPIHLHGHDFFILAAGANSAYDSTVALNLNNPPRRDVATLPAAGYLVIAFYTDNPGAWLMHCHIGWHTSQGLALQFVEREPEIPGLLNSDILTGTCANWETWAALTGRVEEDSGV
ncbi:laccase Lcc4 [Corynespora cassiicola Philippines]|uniref:laccase n=1 Tax=Corynespora cassiicola Philippines TaxID=1448308 RepID=A0A2T2NMD7_CORCC|nr:laccase Lcc4 [Corynespora cassiicola Philippines]